MPRLKRLAGGAIALLAGLSALAPAPSCKEQICAYPVTWSAQEEDVRASRAAPRRDPPTMSTIKHLVVVIQENHTFDNYFARYCRAPVGSGPTCTVGPDCCEAGPERDARTGRAPVVLDDAANAGFDPDHSEECELGEMNGGKMDRFVEGWSCSDPRTFAYASPEASAPMWRLAREGALADRYFQPIAGASSANDMYFARAQFVFSDNDRAPLSSGVECRDTPKRTYTDPTIGDLLKDNGVPWAFYAEGYREMLEAADRGLNPGARLSCPAHTLGYPCTYDPSDVPFQYYVRFHDSPEFIRDLPLLWADRDADRLPAVSFVKFLGYYTEHPGAGTTVSAGMRRVDTLLDNIFDSTRISMTGEPLDFREDTLVLVTYDEGGGYFDHIAPPPPSAADGKPYGTRVPMIALGHFARRTKSRMSSWSTHRS